MKDLHLLRHAKSSWSDPARSDRERPLNKRGQRDAPRMGKALRQFLSPLPLAVSSACRAQLTLAGLCEGWPELALLEHGNEEELYTFSATGLATWIRRQQHDPPALFLLSHNPGLTDLVNFLDGGVALYNLPTAGYAHLAVDVDHWHELRPGCGRVVQLLFPKHI